MGETDLYFKISSGLKNLIGADLISDDFIAVFELVKNSYDAYATEVKIVFERNQIIITDNGKGMSYDDILNKWLFVAYSAKKLGTEDEDLKKKEFADYRSKIITAKYYAGAKGIGRFSCDRLGSKLTLITKQSAKNSKPEQINIDWGKFEVNPETKFEKVKVKYVTPPTVKLANYRHGTTLIITNLRSSWSRVKILELKHSLEKLINPFDIVDNSRKSVLRKSAIKFGIEVIAEKEKSKDLVEVDVRKKVNGFVKNFVFETLGLKTTQIFTEISSDGKNIITELVDRGKIIYRLSEKNPYPKLSNIRFHLFYLNRAAKYNFKTLMGISSVEFGSVFLYKNGFRVYPFGEEGEDSFGIDRRKQQGHARYLGTREIIGRIEIFGNDEEFRETTSRDGGLKITDGYLQLKDSFIEKCLKRLERYVVDIQWTLKDQGEDLSNIENNLVASNLIANVIAKLVDSDDVKLEEYPKDFLDVINEKLSLDSTDEESFTHIERIARKTGDKKFLTQINRAKTKFSKLKREKEEAEAKARIQEEERAKLEVILKERESENLFLKSIKSQDFDEIISFLHHIGISASINDNYLNGIHNKIKGLSFPKKENFLELMRLAIFENKKILNISKFATKANFKLYTDAVELDLLSYIREYINNIVAPVTGEDLKIRFEDYIKTPIKIRFRPIEINILLDNLISNSKKAGATTFNISLSRKDKKSLEIAIEDNGGGIPKEDVAKIFQFGYTTTGGSGIGLYHVKEIVERLGGDIYVAKTNNKGTKFIVEI